MKLNIGCGENKIEGYFNLDGNPSLNPDINLDIRFDKLPYLDEELDEVLMFHTIEHIQRAHHDNIFIEINRVLKVDGLLLLSYPEFEICAKYFIDNYKDDKRFWEKTLYGRQSSSWDYHVCAMDTQALVQNLKRLGFEKFLWLPEKEEEYNTALKCNKKFMPKSREEVIRDEVFI